MKTLHVLFLCAFAAVLPVSAQTPPPENLRLAEELCDLVKFDGGFDGMLKQMKESQARFGLKTSSASDEAFRTFFEAAKAKARPIVVEVYASNFTAEELQGMIAFFKTPLGQKWIQSQPVVQAQIMQKMQAVFLEMQPELLKSLMKDMPGAPKSP